MQFALPIYPGFHIYFSFSFSPLTFNYSKPTKIYFILQNQTSSKHKKLFSVLQNLHNKAIKINY